MNPPPMRPSKPAIPVETLDSLIVSPSSDLELASVLTLQHAGHLVQMDRSEELFQETGHDPLHKDVESQLLLAVFGDLKKPPLCENDGGDIAGAT